MEPRNRYPLDIFHSEEGWHSDLIQVIIVSAIHSQMLSYFFALYIMSEILATFIFAPDHLFSQPWSPW